MKMKSKFENLYRLVLESIESSDDLSTALKTLEVQLNGCSTWKEVLDVYNNFFEPTFVRGGWKRDVKAYDTGYGMVKQRIMELGIEPDDDFFEIAKSY